MISKLRQVFKTKNISALLITKPENVFYLSGFTGSFGQVLITKTKQYLITDFRYLGRAQKELRDPKFEVIAVLELPKIMKRLKKVGFEEADLTVGKLKKFKKLYKYSQLIGLNNAVEKLRCLKTEEEILKIKKAARIANKVLQKVKPYLKPKVTEKEIVRRIRTLIWEEGGDDISFPPIVAFGKNSAIPHHEPGATKLKKGDFILIDLGVKYQGYCSDMTRTFCLQKFNKKQQEIYDLVFTAQQKTLAAVRPGVKIKKLDAIARGVITEAGYGENFGHALGHGVGLEIHEAPAVSALSKDVLEEGMVITIEPGVYLEGWGGVRIEDLVVVGSKFKLKVIRRGGQKSKRRTVQNCLVLTDNC